MFDDLVAMFDQLNREMSAVEPEAKQWAETIALAERLLEMAGAK